MNQLIADQQRGAEFNAPRHSRVLLQITKILVVSRCYYLQSPQYAKQVQSLFQIITNVYLLLNKQKLQKEILCYTRIVLEATSNPQNLASVLEDYESGVFQLSQGLLSLAPPLAGKAQADALLELTLARRLKAYV